MNKVHDLKIILQLKKHYWVVTSPFIHIICDPQKWYWTRQSSDQYCYLELFKIKSLCMLLKLTDAILLLHLAIVSPLIHALDDPSQALTEIRTWVSRLRGSWLTNWAIPPPSFFQSHKLYIWDDTIQQMQCYVCLHISFIYCFNVRFLNIDQKINS